MVTVGEPAAKMSKEVGEEYSSSLADLTMNSKPLINMLTILAEESVVHAPVIVQAVEKHLDKVRAEIKLPVLYLVDSIIKNVGGAYTQLFSSIIVNMFCKVFKQVDEKTRSQMFKLRETWHDVFPAIKLYQLDVKVNLIDPAWPIQARPPQTNIHVNPNFFSRATTGTTPSPTIAPVAVAPTLTPDEINMREAIARKEQELLELARKEKELLEQKKALEKRAASQKKILDSVIATDMMSTTVGAKQKSVVPVVITPIPQSTLPKIAPVNPALLNTARRRDPRLAHIQGSLTQPSSTPSVPENQTVTSTVTKRSDPRVLKKGPESVVDQKHESVSQSKSDKSPSKSSHRHSEKKRDKDRVRELSENSVNKPVRISKLPPIPKIKAADKQVEKHVEPVSPSSPTKRKKDSDSPKSSRKHKKSKESSPKEIVTCEKSHKKSSSDESKRHKVKKLDLEMEQEPPSIETFKEMKRRSKERNYIRRNREKSESPDEDVDLRLQPPNPPATTVPESNGSSGDVDFRTLVTPVPISQTQRKRSPPENEQHEPNKKSKSEKLDELFGNEDVDLRKLAVVDERPRPDDIKNDESKTPSNFPLQKTKVIDENDDKDSNEEDEDTVESSLGNIQNVEGGWAKVKEIQSPQVLQKQPSLSNFDIVRAKLAKATKKDGLGRPRIFVPTDEMKEKKEKKSNSKDTDMRFKNKNNLDGDSLDNNIKIIMLQAEEQLISGNINQDQYNVLLMQVLKLNEKQMLKEAKQKDSLEASKRRLQWLQQKNANDKSEDERSSSPDSARSTDSPLNSVPGGTSLSAFGDIDERVPPTILLPNTNVNTIPEEMKHKHKDSDMRMLNRMSEKHTSPKREINMVLPRPELQHPMTAPIGDQNFMSHAPDMQISRSDMGMFRPDMNMGKLRQDNSFGGPPWSQGPRGFPPRGFRGPRPRNEEWGGPRGFRGRGSVGGNWRMPMGNRPMVDMPDRMPVPNQPFFPVEPRKGLFLGPNPTPPYIRNEESPPQLLGASPSKEYIRIDPSLLEYMQRDTMKSISIDGVTREIRFYDTTALVMIDWDDPRDIFFQNGQRRVCIDDVTLSLNFNDGYIPFTLDGVTHKIKFGAPTRELFIDDMWFECFFGGPPIPILLDGKVRLVKLDGPPPQVTIGENKRTDLCAGKINLIVDALTTVPIFLDAKPQLVDIGRVPHSLRFVDSLETVLINEKPYQVEFGGYPKPLLVNKKKHYIRFTVLPRSVRAGAVNIVNMEGKKPDPMVVPPFVSGAITTLPTVEPVKPTMGGLDMLASLLPSSVAPSSQVEGNYSALSTTNTPQNAPAIPPLQNIDVNSLFAKLVETGILQNINTNKTQPEEAPASVGRNKINDNAKKEEKPVEVATPSPSLSNKTVAVKPVDIKKPETLKIKQPGLVNALHLGIQCGSCGTRFPPEHTTRYSQHLDWHFRQNRAEKDSQRRPHSRRWYYDISDWVQFEEIEDLEEREKSWFERQQEEGAAVEVSETVPSVQEEVNVVAPPPCAPMHQFKCGHCGDPFDQFYNQESEEWQLRRAVTYENNNYHPDCLEEYKESLLEVSTKESKDADTSVSSEKVESKTEDEWKDEDVEMETSDNIDELEQDNEDQNTSADAQQDDESVVEVLSEKSQEEEEDVELLEDDDVVIKTEPVVQITVEDEDTDEEVEKERAARDEQYEIDFANIKIKQEPIDPDDEPVITSTEIVTTHADTTHAAVISSIDGNVQLQPATVQSVVAPAIRINITKPIVPASNTPPPKPASSENTDQIVNNEEESPEVEPEYTVKSSLENVIFTKHAPVMRGNELSGLCSLM